MDNSLKTDIPIKLNLALKSIIEKERLITYEIDVRHVSTEGCSFIGMLYEINISGVTEDRNHKELFLFAKHIIDGTHIKRLCVRDWYITELFAYKEIFPIFAEIQEQANVPIDERYQVAKFYDESNTEVLIMENLTKRGFTTYPRTQVAPLNFYETVVRQLARFHGVSFALRERKPDLFNEKIKPLKYPYPLGEIWKQAMEDLKNVSINYVDEHLKDKLVQLYENAVPKYEQYCTDEAIKICLCHGDYRFSNFMIKLDNDELEEIIHLDFQTLHYGCPVFDFLYLIFLGTDREFRKAHLSNLKELYYETLGIFLKYFDLEVDCVYPRADFEKVYKEKLDCGLICALTYLPVVLSTPNTLPDFTQSRMSFCCDGIIKDRLQEMIEEFTDWGFI